MRYDDIATGEQLRKARTEAGFTLTALAFTMGLTPNNLSRLERGIEHHNKRAQQGLELLR
jgi:transcriptional regulator with XRE-family HTH domain